MRAADDLQLPSSQWLRSDLEPEPRLSPFLTPLNETERWPNQIVHESGQLPVDDERCRFDNNVKIKPALASYLASISKSAPLEQGAERWRLGISGEAY